MFCCCGEGIFEIMFGMLLRWLYNLFSILEDWSFQWANDHWGYHRPLMFDETFWESTTANNHTLSLSLSLSSFSPLLKFIIFKFHSSLLIKYIILSATSPSISHVNHISLYLTTIMDGNGESKYMRSSWFLQPQ